MVIQTRVPVRTAFDIDVQFGYIAVQIAQTFMFIVRTDWGHSIIDVSEKK